MTDTFQFDLVSPERALVSKPVAAVILPGSEGQFTVLAGHAPVIATLDPGLIEVFEQESGAGEQIFVKGGLAEVKPTGLIVLAEESIDPKTADAAALRKELDALTADLAAADSDYARDLVTKEIAWREALVELL